MAAIMIAKAADKPARNTIARTMEWYYQRHAKQNPGMLDFSIKQIDEYVKAAQRKHLTWAAGK